MAATLITRAKLGADKTAEAFETLAAKCDRRLRATS